MSTAQEPRAVAIKAALVAGMPAGWVVYEVDEVPGSTGGPTGTPAARYVSFELGRRKHGDNYRGDADMVPGWALTTHYRAPNVTDVRRGRDAVTAALENRAYDLPDGDTFGPFSFQFDEQPDYIDGGWSAFDIWNA